MTDEQALDECILTASFLYWLVASCRREYWRINESHGSSIAGMAEGAD
jgi:hypothetical protein